MQSIIWLLYEWYQKDFRHFVSIFIRNLDFFLLLYCYIASLYILLSIHARLELSLSHRILLCSKISLPVTLQLRRMSRTGKVGVEKTVTPQALIHISAKIAEEVWLEVIIAPGLRRGTPFIFCSPHTLPISRNETIHGSIYPESKQSNIHWWRFCFSFDAYQKSKGGGRRSVVGGRSHATFLFINMVDGFSALLL